MSHITRINTDNKLWRFVDLFLPEEVVNLDHVWRRFVNELQREYQGHPRLQGVIERERRNYLSVRGKMLKEHDERHRGD